MVQGSSENAGNTAKIKEKIEAYGTLDQSKYSRFWIFREEQILKRKSEFDKFSESLERLGVFFSFFLKEENFFQFLLSFLFQRKK